MIMDGEPRALGGEGLRHRRAEPTIAAGDEDALAAEIELHSASTGGAAGRSVLCQLSSLPPPPKTAPNIPPIAAPATPVATAPPMPSLAAWVPGMWRKISSARFMIGIDWSQ